MGLNIAERIGYGVNGDPAAYVRGRVRVLDVLRHLCSGQSAAEVRRELDIEFEDVLACLWHAADAVERDDRINRVLDKYTPNLGGTDDERGPGKDQA